MTATIRETVTSTMQAAGLGSYVRYADEVIRSLESDSSDPYRTIDEFITRNRYTQYRDAGRRVAEAVAALGGTTMSGSTTGMTEAEAVDTIGFDRQRAAEVIRDAAHRADIDEDEVESVLIEAGLVDAPTQAADSDEMAALRQEVETLKTFARRHGFNG